DAGHGHKQPCSAWVKAQEGDRPSEKPRNAVMVESRPYGRDAAGVADCLSLVFHLVDPLLVLLPKRCMAAYDRDQRLGLHSRNHLRSRGAAQEFSSDVVARIRSRLPLAGLLLLGRAQVEAIYGSAGGCKILRLPMKAKIDLDVGSKTFASGLLP